MRGQAINPLVSSDIMCESAFKFPSNYYCIIFFSIFFQSFKILLMNYINYIWANTNTTKLEDEKLSLQFNNQALCPLFIYTVWLQNLIEHLSHCIKQSIKPSSISEQNSASSYRTNQGQVILVSNNFTQVLLAE